MEEQGQTATLSGFSRGDCTDHEALTAWIRDQDYVLLMTLHSARSLEFPSGSLRNRRWDVSSYIPLYQMTDLIWKEEKGSVMWVSAKLWRICATSARLARMLEEKYSIIKYQICTLEILELAGSGTGSSGKEEKD